MQTRRLLQTSLALFGALAFVSANANGQPKCGGNNHVPHAKNGYEFVTSSWLRAESNGHMYRTCVENLSGDRLLWFNWFIPGLTGYVPAGKSMTKPRYYTQRENADINGCLQYGNHHYPMKELFIGHRNELEDASKERDCQVAPNRFGQDLQPLFIQSPAKIAADPIELNSDFYVATNSRNPEGTLIYVAVTTGLRRINDNSFRSFIRYDAKPAPGSDGRIDHVLLRTDSLELRQALMKSGHKDGVIRLSKYSDSFDAVINKSDTVEIGNARFGFFDGNGVLVGTVFAPVPLGK